jgi:lysophospholipase L1-like esterase
VTTRRALAFVAALAIGVCAVARAEARPAGVRIVLVGDSTTAPETGWGDAFCALAAKVTCLNMAKGGRSSKSYRAEGAWAKVQAVLAQKGPWRRTYVFIQFGHNDQPGKAERSSDLATEFIPNLNAYVADVRAAGATPVLISPLSRRQFKGGLLQDDLSPWAGAARRAARETHSTLLDLAGDSAFAMQTLGPVKAMDFAMAPPPPDVAAAAATGTTIEAPKLPPEEAIKHHYFDYTHLGPKGAEFFSMMVRDEARAALPELAKVLN